LRDRRCAARARALGRARGREHRPLRRLVAQRLSRPGVAPARRVVAAAVDVLLPAPARTPRRAPRAAHVQPPVAGHACAARIAAASVDLPCRPPRRAGHAMHRGVGAVPVRGRVARRHQLLCAAPAACADRRAAARFGRNGRARVRGALRHRSGLHDRLERLVRARRHGARALQPADRLQRRGVPQRRYPHAREFERRSAPWAPHAQRLFRLHAALVGL
ncbi:MAG: hypothetical protein AVDCRST_MAG71-608, partial [uncultured Lysobacter sp.]